MILIVLISRYFSVLIFSILDLIRPSPSRGHGQSDGWRQGVDGPSDVSVRLPRTPRGELREGCTATKSNMSAG